MLMRCRAAELEVEAVGLEDETAGGGYEAG